jgi:hypothetical protein
MSKNKIAQTKTKTTTKTATTRSAKPAAKAVDFDDPEVQRKIGALAIQRAREEAAREEAAREEAATREPSASPWNGADRFRETARAEDVLRATFWSAQVDSENVLELAIERALDELGVLELSFESDASVIEAGPFVERVRHGLAAALWLHQREVGAAR